MQTLANEFSIFFGMVSLGSKRKI